MIDNCSQSTVKDLAQSDSIGHVIELLNDMERFHSQEVAYIRAMRERLLAGSETKQSANGRVAKFATSNNMSIRSLAVAALVANDNIMMNNGMLVDFMEARGKVIGGKSKSGTVSSSLRNYPKIFEPCGGGYWRLTKDALEAAR